MATGSTILVTGGTGFFGGAIARRAVELGARTVVTARRVDVEAPPGAGLRLVDLTDVDAATRTFAEVAPDIIVHAAGRAAPAVDWAGRQALWRDNLTVAEATLEAARRACPGAAIVAIGSAAQYGGPAGPAPIAEDHPWRPAGVYGAAKAAAGMAVLERARNGGLNASLAIPFNLIGPGQPATLVPAAFLARMRQTRGAIEVGDVEAVRDFLDVRDAARAVLAIALSARSRGAGGEVFNICRGKGAKVVELLELLREAVGGSLSWVSRGGPDPVRSVVGDPSRLVAATGFAPAFGLDRSIGDMVRAWGALPANRPASLHAS